MNLQVSVEKSKKLENLATVMTLYSRRTFSKESFQWTKCVVKYLWDTYAHLSLQMLAFLVEVLERGAPCLQLPVLSILHCMLHYIDLNTSMSQPINADLLRVIAKFIDVSSFFLSLFFNRCVFPVSIKLNGLLILLASTIFKILFCIRRVSRKLMYLDDKRFLSLIFF